MKIEPRRYKEVKIDEIEKWKEEVYSQVMEMANFKSDFDIEKFTVMKEGKFIAHNFHFLMRQYSLALYEAKRLAIEREKKKRKLERIKKEQPEDWDLEVLRLENEIYLIEIDLKANLHKISGFEKARQKLIQLNGGKVPTNEDYQKEEPEYWKWNLSRQIMQEFTSVQTGISKGVWNAIDMCEYDTLFEDSKNRIKFRKEDGSLDLTEIKKNLLKIDNKNLNLIGGKDEDSRV